MAAVTMALQVRKRWWAGAAIFAASIALRAGLIRGANGAEHHDGRITANERAAKWIVAHAFVIEAR